jgi:tryptophanyl-tRNA synthetase
MLTAKNTKEDIQKTGENARYLVLDTLSSGVNPDFATFYLQSSIPRSLRNEYFVSKLKRIPSLKDMAKDAGRT